MSREKKLVPKMRFKEFEDSQPWQNKDLGDMVNFYSGLTYSPSNIVEEPGTLVIRSSNIKNSEIVNADNVYVDSTIANSENVQIGDIIVVVRNGSRHLIGKNAQVKTPMENTVIGAFMTGIRSNTSKFINALLDTNKFQIEIYKDLGATINQITTGNLRKMKFNFPNEDEANKIGTYFEEIDNLIISHRKKINKVKDIKSAYLSEMFPKEGEKYPKKRFEGFTEPWKKRKLDSIANNFDMLRIPVTAADRIPGDTPYYGANGIQDYVEGHTHDGEYILLAEDGANDLKNYPVHFVNGKVWVNNHAHVLQGNPGVLDNRFLMYKLKTINMEPYLVGGGRAKLNANIMMNIELLLPNLEEQSKIGTFFKNLDNQISIEEEKLSKLEKLKQAYLNDMFI